MGKAEAVAVAYVVGLIALCVALGWVAGSIPVGLLAFGAVLAVHLAASRATESPDGLTAAVAAVGVCLQAAAAQAAGYAGGWLWSIPWALAAILLAASAVAVPSRAVALRVALFALGGLCAAMVLAGPLLLAGPAQVTLPDLALPDFAGWIGTGASAAWATVTSGWGVLYLAVAFLVGTLWSVRSGGVVALLVVLGVIAWSAVVTAGSGHGRAAELLALDPPALARAFLAATAGWFGSPGWGALLLGVVLVVVVLPSIRRSAAGPREAGGQGAAALALVHPVLIAGVVLGLWLALGGVAGALTATSFLFIPDIRLPNLAPVWEAPYFVLAALLGVMTVINERTYRRLGLRDQGQSVGGLAWILGSMLLALGVPAGVMLFLLGHNLCTGIASALFGSRAMRARARRPAQRSDEEVRYLLRKLLEAAEAPAKAPGPSPVPRPNPVAPRPRPAAAPRPRPAVTPPIAATLPEPAPDLGATMPEGSFNAAMPRKSFGAGAAAAGATVFAGSPGPADGDGVLYRSQVPLIDLARVGDDHLLLREDGHVARWHAHRLGEVEGIALDRPVGLAPGKEGEVIAADGASRFFRLRIPDAGPPEVATYRVDRKVACFAVNPFGTIVVYAPARGREVLAVLLASGAGQVLCEDAGPVTALAFAAGGRELAMGQRDGRVRILDMATRQVTRELAPPHGEAGRVVSVAACPGGAWTAAYASDLLVRWDADGAVAATRHEGHALSSLAVSPSGLVAAGSADGHVMVHPADLGGVDLDAVGCDDRVVRLAFEADQRSVLSAGHDGTVRRAVL